MLGDNFSKCKSTFAVLCLLIELVIVTTTIYDFRKIFRGEAAKIKKSSVNVKNNNQ